MATTSGKHTSFMNHTEGLGCVTHRRSVRLVFIGVIDNVGELILVDLVLVDRDIVMVDI
jgi:hypothetical protein